MTDTDFLTKNNEASKTAYLPADIEAKWTDIWFKQNIFNLKIEPNKPSFSVALPPPNITGNLHMGHALNGTLQDLLTRLKRMQGFNVLWQPGTDHAGISAQMVVERELKKQGKLRRDMGRDAFIAEVWKWRKQYGDQIMNQYKRLGVSFNWDRLAFTMDESYVKAIYKAFVTLFNEGFIYRGNRVTNWCPRCLTSLSDLEVIHEERKSKIYHIKYLFVDDSVDYPADGITIATTRPESLFADVAVAVHPNDERYIKLVGKEVILPLTKRKIPIIADTYVDREFGTGALKITPGHDANDWEVGQRHKLSTPVVIDIEGKLARNELVPEKYQGKDRFAVRDMVAEDLQELLVEVRDHHTGVGLCDRCGTVIEPQLSDQWYMRMKDLAKPAIECVEGKEIVFIPERYAASYLDWMRNIRDWNISRQLWWGQRIPVWTCKKCNEVAAFEEPPKSCTKCGATELEQDPDVLDTWFSSALWPFATLGWPEQTEEMEVFYPTTILSTARDIINLWVARMIFMSLKLLNKVPYKEVLIHPVVQTADGKRMSKSKGNVVDPLQMIEKYGADANRFWFLSLGVKGDQDVRFREQKLEEYKRFVNKLWNAGRFVLSQTDKISSELLSKESLSLADRWILHRYNTLLKTLEDSFKAYDFHIVAQDLYEFIWDYYCDWYLEIAKIQMQNEGDQGNQTKQILLTIFEGLLRALHPVMPYVTEELWSRIHKLLDQAKLSSIMFASYPKADAAFLDPKAEADMDILIRIIRSIRNIRQTYNVPASAEVTTNLISTDPKEIELIQANIQAIEKLARATITLNQDDKSQTTHSATVTIASTAISVPLDNLIDIEKTKDKLNQRKHSVEKELLRTKQIFTNDDFKAKAPPDKVETIKAELEDLEQQIKNIQTQLNVLE